MQRISNVCWRFDLGFLMVGDPFMQLGTCDDLKCPDVKQFIHSLMSIRSGGGFKKLGPCTSVSL